VDAQLSHTDPNQISSAYNHAEYVEQRRAMMQDWADRLDAWANHPPDADKIPMNASSAQVVVSHTNSPPDPAPAHAAVADNTMASSNPDAPLPAPPSPMTIIARRDQRPQPVVTDFQRAHAEMLATFEAPQNLPVPVFAKLAGKSRDQINREIKARRLLSISLGNRGQRIPEWQLNPLCQSFVCQVMERAQRIDSWVLYRALSEPRDDLEGLAPVAAVTAGKLAVAEELVFAQLGLD
jgi:hypothetical protein